MNPVTTPYAPGAGTPLPLLAGRDGVIEAWGFDRTTPAEPERP